MTYIPTKNIWGETSTACETSAKARLHSSPVTRSLSAEKPVAPFPAEKSVEALEMLKAEFDVRFSELHVHAKESRLFQNPFAADIDEVNCLALLSVRVG